MSRGWVGTRASGGLSRSSPRAMRTPVVVAGGALVGADNYVASEDDSLLSPDQLRGVVDTEWASQERAVELAQPFPAAALAGKPATLDGLKLTAAVAADKLEAYSPQAAQVSVWSEITIWSSTVAPTQRW